MILSADIVRFVAFLDKSVSRSCMCVWLCSVCGYKSKRNYIDMSMNPNFDSIGKEFVRQYYAQFDSNRSLLAPLYVSILSFFNLSSIYIYGFYYKFISPSVGWDGSLLSTARIPVVGFLERWFHADVWRPTVSRCQWDSNETTGIYIYIYKYPLNSLHFLQTLDPCFDTRFIVLSMH